MPRSGDNTPKEKENRKKGKQLSRGASDTQRHRLKARRNLVQAKANGIEHTEINQAIDLRKIGLMKGVGGEAGEEFVPFGGNKPRRETGK